MSVNKVEQAVFEIFRMTHEGSLQWRHQPVPSSWKQATETAYVLYFETLFEGRKLALFQTRSRTPAQERKDGEWMGEEVLPWRQKIHLALLGDHDEIMFEFPFSGQVRDLFDAVRYKESNVEEFLDQILKPAIVNQK